jgi:hypothetical protein
VRVRVFWCSCAFSAIVCCFVCSRVRVPCAVWPHVREMPRMRTQCLSWPAVSAGLYVFGAERSNECPAKTALIVDQASCLAAAVAAGKPFGSGVVEPNSPRGCCLSTLSNVVYLNTDAVGAGNSGRRLLCAVSTGTADGHGQQYGVPPSTLGVRGRYKSQCAW